MEVSEQMELEQVEGRQEELQGVVQRERQEGRERLEQELVRPAKLVQGVALERRVQLPLRT